MKAVSGPPTKRTQSVGGLFCWRISLSVIINMTYSCRVVFSMIIAERERL